MAINKGRKKIDWSIAIENVTRLSREELVEGGAGKQVVNALGLDGLLAVLTPEQQRDFAKRIEARSKQV